MTSLTPLIGSEQAATPCFPQAARSEQASCSRSTQGGRQGSLQGACIRTPACPQPLTTSTTSTSTRTTPPVPRTKLTLLPVLAMQACYSALPR